MHRLADMIAHRRRESWASDRIASSQ